MFLESRPAKDSFSGWLRFCSDRFLEGFVGKKKSVNFPLSRSEFPRLKLVREKEKRRSSEEWMKRVEELAPKLEAWRVSGINIK